MDGYPSKRLFLHATTLEKWILTHTSDDEVSAVFDRLGLPGSTDAAVTDRSTLEEEIHLVWERGYAIDDGERPQWLWCIGAPVTAGSR